MTPYFRVAAVTFLSTLACLLAAAPARAEGNLHKVNHIIIVVQENHSFDNYFGVLPYAPGTPYHAPTGVCAASDHQCVDGLKCTPDASGNLACSNTNLDDDGSVVAAFHATSRCVKPDLDHSWLGTHQEINFENPNATSLQSFSNGFVRVNDATEQIDSGENRTKKSEAGTGPQIYYLL